MFAVRGGSLNPWSVSAVTNFKQIHNRDAKIDVTTPKLRQSINQIPSSIPDLLEEMRLRCCLGCECICLLASCDCHCFKDMFKAV